MRICKGSGSEFLGNIFIIAAAMLIVTLSITLASSALTDQICEDIDDPITDFYPPASTKYIVFNDAGADNTTKVQVPIGFNVYNATMNVTGIPIALAGVKNLADIVVVNDISGSMVYNCGEDKIAQPGETPCKINDMKDATKSFIDILLDYEDNMAGLVSYSTDVVSWMTLTNDKTSLFAEIDTYVAMNETCISCAIEKGIELLEDSEKEDKAILLMTDGNANRCTYGVCTPEMAKNQALNRAAMAWEYYNINIYTVAFGEDADTELMEQIADVSNGVYYYAADTDIVDVYNQIATDVTYSFPINLGIDFGTDGSAEWSYPGQLIGTETVDFTFGLNGLTDCTCPGCNVNSDDCIIDVEISTDAPGMVRMDYLEITGCVPEEPEPPEPADHVLFYQVYYNTIGTESLEEWFELYNPTETSIDLSGMKIFDYVGPGIEIPEQTPPLEPGEYFTIARNKTGFFNLYGCNPDLDGFTRGLNNGDDLLRLTDQTETDEVDFVAWGGKEGWYINASEDKSILRFPPDQDTDSPSDWLSDQDALPWCVTGDPCYGVMCEDRCEGWDWHYNGECVEGGCVYDIDNESELCMNDEDDDGYYENVDCDDSNPDVNPGATEICNGIDDDCDGAIDEGCGTGGDGNGGGDGGDGGGLCLPAWDCTAWSDCINDEQTRTCTDDYHCNTDYNKPPTTQSCGEEPGETFVCVEGDMECSGDTVIQCVDNEWQDVETCNWGCIEGVCEPEPDEVIIEEDTTTGGAGFITAGSPEFWGMIIAIIIIIAIAIWLKRRKK